MIDVIRSTAPTVSESHHVQVTTEAVRATATADDARLWLILRCLDRMKGGVAADKRAHVKKNPILKKTGADGTMIGRTGGKRRLTTNTNAVPGKRRKGANRKERIKGLFEFRSTNQSIK